MPDNRSLYEACIYRIMLGKEGAGHDDSGQGDEVRAALHAPEAQLDRRSCIIRRLDLLTGGRWRVTGGVLGRGRFKEGRGF